MREPAARSIFSHVRLNLPSDRSRLLPHRRPGSPRRPWGRRDCRNVASCWISRGRCGSLGADRSCQPLRLSSKTPALLHVSTQLLERREPGVADAAATGQRKVESSTLTNSSKSRDHGAEQLFQVILRLLEVIILTGAPSTALPLGAAILKIFVSPWNRNLPFCVWSSDAVGRIVDIFAVAPDDLKRQQKLRGADAEDSASNTVGSVNTLVVAQQQVGKRIRGHVCALQSVNDKVIGGPECSLIGCSALGRLLLHCFFLDDFGRGTGIRGQAVNLALSGAAPCRASFGGSERRLSSPATHRGQIASSFDTDSCRNPGWIPALSKR
jgi:hypothetical protein